MNKYLEKIAAKLKKKKPMGKAMRNKAKKIRKSRSYSRFLQD